MNKEDIIKEIGKLRVELAMQGYHDGWSIMGITKRLEQLEELLKKEI